MRGGDDRRYLIEYHAEIRELLNIRRQREEHDRRILAAMGVEMRDRNASRSRHSRVVRSEIRSLIGDVADRAIRPGHVELSPDQGAEKVRAGLEGHVAAKIRRGGIWRNYRKARIGDERQRFGARIHDFRGGTGVSMLGHYRILIGPTGKQAVRISVSPCSCRSDEDGRLILNGSVNAVARRGSAPRQHDRQA